MGKVYAAIAVLIVLAVIGFDYRRTLQKNATLEDANRTLATAVEQQRLAKETAENSLRILDAQMQEKQRNDQELQTQVRRIVRQLGELRSADPVVRDWLDSPIPPGVRELLRKTPSGGRKNDVPSPAGSVDNPDA